MYICSQCREECEIEKEAIHYSGTHCTHGLDGVHYTGFWVSTCCGGEYGEDDGEADDS